MKNKQFALLLLAVFGGCTLGTYLSGNMPKANAQVPPGNNPITETLTVPEKGLKIMSYTNKQIALLGTEGQGAFLTLYDTQGQPSVVIRARSGAQTTVGDIGSGTGFAVRSANNTGFTGAIAGDNAYMGVSRGNSATNGLSVNSQGTSLTLSGTSGGAVYEVLADVNGTSLRLGDNSGIPLFQVLRKDSRSLMSLIGMGSRNKTEFNAGGQASAQSTSGTLWKLPVD